jgi:predicted dehydrogenase
LDPRRDAAMRDVVERSGVAFMMEFPRRFAPATLRLKELIATRLGHPRLVFCHARRQTENPSRSNGTGRDPSHRELLELIDWCRYVVGREPSSVTSCGHVMADEPPHAGTSSPHTIDYRAMSLLFPGDPEADKPPRSRKGSKRLRRSDEGEPRSRRRPPVTAQISVGSYIRPLWKEAIGFRPPAAMQVCCERGVAFVDLPSSLVWFDDAGRHLESLDTELPVGERLLSQFHRAVTSLVRNLSDLDDAYRAAKILAAAERSDREGCRIAIE